MSKRQPEKQELNIKKLQEKSDEYLAGWQRAKADYENLQKQVLREKEEFIKFANLNLIMQLIPVYEHLKLSFKHLPDEIKDNNWVKGIEQIKKQFKQVLAENGVEEIAPKVGDGFSPELHEAIDIDGEELRIKNQELKDINKISRVVAGGYKLNGKVVVAAKVIVE